MIFKPTRIRAVIVLILFHLLIGALYYISERGHYLDLTIDISNNRISAQIAENKPVILAGHSWKINKLSFSVVSKECAYSFAETAWDNIKIVDKDSDEVIFEADFDNPDSLEKFEIKGKDAVYINYFNQLVIKMDGVVTIPDLELENCRITLSVINYATPEITGWDESGDRFNWEIRNIPDSDQRLMLLNKNGGRRDAKAGQYVRPWQGAALEIVARFIRFYVIGLGMMVAALIISLLTMLAVWLYGKINSIEHRALKLTLQGIIGLGIATGIAFFVYKYYRQMSEGLAWIAQYFKPEYFTYHLIGLIFIGSCIVVLLLKVGLHQLLLKIFKRQAPTPEPPDEHLPLVTTTSDEGQSSERRRNIWRYVSGGLILLIAGLTVAGLGAVADLYLERIPHVQDSVCQYFQAKYMAHGKLYIQQPAVKEAFGMQFMVMKDGKWYSKYPFGWPIMLMWGYLLGFPWLVPPFMMGLSILFTYFVCVRAFNSRLTGVLAGAIIAVSPFTIYLGGSLMNHAYTQFLQILAVWMAIRMFQRSGFWMGMALGLIIGLVFNTRPMNGLSLIPLVYCFWLYVFIRSSEKKRLFKGILGVCLGGLIMLGLFLQFNKEITGDHFRMPYQQLGAHFSYISHRSDLEDYFQSFNRSLQLLNGYIAAMMIVVLNFPFEYTWFTFAFLVLVFMTRKFNRYDVMMLFGIAFLFAAYFPYPKVVLIYGPRYYYEIVPLIAILTIRGPMLLGDWAKDWFNFWFKKETSSRIPMFVVRIVVLSFLFSLSWANLTQYLNSEKYRGSKIFAFMPRKLREIKGFNYTRPHIQNKVKEKDIHNAIVFVDDKGSSAWYIYGSVFPENEPDLNGDIIYVRDSGKTRNKQLMDFYPDREYYITQYDARSPLEKISYVPSWNQDLSALTELKKVPSLRKLAICDDYIAISDFKNSQVFILNPRGLLKHELTECILDKQSFKFVNPLGIAIGPDKNLAVADLGAKAAYRMAPDGRCLIKLDEKNLPGLKVPTDITFDPSGNLFITDGEGHQVFKVKPDGKLIQTIGHHGLKSGEFNKPFGIDCDSQGNFYVADSASHRIQKFSPDGNFILAWHPVFWTDANAGERFISINRETDSIYLTLPDRQEIEKYNPKGKLIWSIYFNPGDNPDDRWTSIAIRKQDDTDVIVAVNKRDGEVRFTEMPEFHNAFIGGRGDAPGQLDNPRHVAVDKDGFLYVTGRDLHRVQKFDSDGDYIREWGRNGPSEARLNEPNGISTYKNNIYVSNIKDSYISRFTDQGVYLDTIQSNDKFRMFSPFDVETDANGNVYISNTGHRNVHAVDKHHQYKFTFGGKGEEEGLFKGDIFSTVVDNHNKRILVTERTLPRIQVFDLNGNFQQIFPYSGFDIAPYYRKDGSTYYLVTGYKGQLKVLDIKGEEIGRGFHPPGADARSELLSICRDERKNDLIVLDYHDNKLIRVTASVIENYLKNELK